MRNPNRQVPFAAYIAHVHSQIIFLQSINELHLGATLSEGDLREMYERGVSVDGAAAVAR